MAESNMAAEGACSTCTHDKSLDFVSPKFEALRALYRLDLQPPIPNIQVFNNLAEYARAIKEGKVKTPVIPKPKTGPNRRTRNLKPEFHPSAIQERLKEIASGKEGQTEDGQASLQRREIAAGLGGAGLMGKPLALGTGRRWKKKHMNVLDKMQACAVGPFSILYKCLEERYKVRVWTRRYKGLRSVLSGYVIAFDKHMNLALMDVDEVYTLEERLEKEFLKEEPCTAKRKKKKKKKHKKGTALGLPTSELKQGALADSKSAENEDNPSNESKFDDKLINCDSALGINQRTSLDTSDSSTVAVDPHLLTSTSEDVLPVRSSDLSFLNTDNRLTLNVPGKLSSKVDERLIPPRTAHSDIQIKVPLTSVEEGQPVDDPALEVTSHNLLTGLQGVMEEDVTEVEKAEYTEASGVSESLECVTERPSYLFSQDLTVKVPLQFSDTPSEMEFTVVGIFQPKSSVYGDGEPFEFPQDLEIHVPLVIAESVSAGNTCTGTAVESTTVESIALGFHQAVGSADDIFKETLEKGANVVETDRIDTVECVGEENTELFETLLTRSSDEENKCLSEGEAMREMLFSDYQANVYDDRNTTESEIMEVDETEFKNENNQQLEANVILSQSDDLNNEESETEDGTEELIAEAREFSSESVAIFCGNLDSQTLSFSASPEGNVLGNSLKILSDLQQVHFPHSHDTSLEKQPVSTCEGVCDLLGIVSEEDAAKDEQKHDEPRDKMVGECEESGQNVAELVKDASVEEGSALLIPCIEPSVDQEVNLKVFESPPRQEEVMNVEEDVSSSKEFPIRGKQLVMGRERQEEALQESESYDKGFSQLQESSDELCVNAENQFHKSENQFHKSENQFHKSENQFHKSENQFHKSEDMKSEEQDEDKLAESAHVSEQCDPQESEELIRISQWKQQEIIVEQKESIARGDDKEYNILKTGLDADVQRAAEECSPIELDQQLHANLPFSFGSIEETLTSNQESLNNKSQIGAKEKKEKELKSSEGSTGTSEKLPEIINEEKESEQEVLLGKESNIYVDLDKDEVFETNKREHAAFHDEIKSNSAGNTVKELTSCLETNTGEESLEEGELTSSDGEDLEPKHEEKMTSVVAATVNPAETECVENLQTDENQGRGVNHESEKEEGEITSSDEETQVAAEKITSRSTQKEEPTVKEKKPNDKNSERIGVKSGAHGDKKRERSSVWERLDFGRRVEQKERKDTSDKHADLSRRRRASKELINEEGHPRDSRRRQREFSGEEKKKDVRRSSREEKRLRNESRNVRRESDKERERTMRIPHSSSSSYQDVKKPRSRREAEGRLSTTEPHSKQEFKITSQVDKPGIKSSRKGNEKEKELNASRDEVKKAYSEKLEDLEKKRTKDRSMLAKSLGKDKGTASDVHVKMELKPEKQVSKTVCGRSTEVLHCVGSKAVAKDDKRGESTKEKKQVIESKRSSKHMEDSDLKSSVKIGKKLTRQEGRQSIETPHATKANKGKEDVVRIEKKAGRTSGKIPSERCLSTSTREYDNVGSKNVEPSPKTTVNRKEGLLPTPIRSWEVCLKPATSSREGKQLSTPTRNPEVQKTASSRTQGLLSTPKRSYEDAKRASGKREKTRLPPPTKRSETGNTHRRSTARQQERESKALTREDDYLRKQKDDGPCSHESEISSLLKRKGMKGKTCLRESSKTNVKHPMEKRSSGTTGKEKMRSDPSATQGGRTDASNSVAIHDDGRKRNETSTHRKVVETPERRAHSKTKMELIKDRERKETSSSRQSLMERASLSRKEGNTSVSTPDVREGQGKVEQGKGKVERRCRNEDNIERNVEPFPEDIQETLTTDRSSCSERTGYLSKQRAGMIPSDGSRSRTSSIERHRGGHVTERLKENVEGHTKDGGHTSKDLLTDSNIAERHTTLHISRNRTLALKSKKLARRTLIGRKNGNTRAKTGPSSLGKSSSVEQLSKTGMAEVVPVVQKGAVLGKTRKRKDSFQDSEEWKIKRQRTLLSGHHGHSGSLALQVQRGEKPKMRQYKGKEATLAKLSEDKLCTVGLRDVVVKDVGTESTEEEVKGRPLSGGSRRMMVDKGKYLVFKRRHVNQLFIRGDNVVMVAYAT